jgi:hypothetical protein
MYIGSRRHHLGLVGVVKHLVRLPGPARAAAILVLSGPGGRACPVIISDPRLPDAEGGHEGRFGVAL